LCMTLAGPQTSKGVAGVGQINMTSGGEGVNHLSAAMFVTPL